MHLGQHSAVHISAACISSLFLCLYDYFRVSGVLSRSSSNVASAQVTLTSGAFPDQSGKINVVFRELPVIDQVVFDAQGETARPTIEMQQTNAQGAGMHEKVS